MSPIHTTRHKEDEEVWKADGVRRHKTNASYKEQKKLLYIQNMNETDQ